MRPANSRVLPAPVPGPGTVLGRKLRLVREISRDTTSTLYTAEHLLLGVVVDVRVLDRTLTHLTHELFASARDAGLLRSPHVCRVVDVGLAPGGIPYVVMQHAAGHELPRLMSVGTATLLASQARSALDEAHAAGIVHGGITREHLRVEDRASGPFLRVTGFELARLRATTYLGKDAVDVDVVAVSRLLAV